MKGRQLSVKEINELKESDRKYFVESKCPELLAEGLYTFDDNYFWAINNEGPKFIGFGKDSYIVTSRKVNIYKWIEDSYETAVKEYSITDVLLELQYNDSLRFKNSTGTEIGMVDGELKWVESNIFVLLTREIITGKFTLVQEVRVSFMEALQAYQKGATIICRHNGDSNEYKPADIKYNILKSVSCKVANVTEMVEGKWYIKGEEK